jgi:hypothetical protein
MSAKSVTAAELADMIDLSPRLNSDLAKLGAAARYDGIAQPHEKTNVVLCDGQPTCSPDERAGATE